MSIQNEIKVELVSASETVVSKSNIRSKRKVHKLDELVVDLKFRGQLQPVIARMEDGKVAILAGQRRRAASLKLEKSNPDHKLKVIIVEADDDESVAISLSENVGQDAMSRLETSKAFTYLVAQGWTVDRIATEYKMEELKVHQILSIGRLPQLVLDAAEKNKLDDEALQVLAMCKPNQVSKWTKAFKAGNAPYYENGVRELVFGDKDPIPTKYALFDVEEAGLALMTDFFEEETFISDADAFWKLQTEAVEAKVEKYRSNGWPVTEYKDWFDSYKYCEGTKAQGAGVFYKIESDGEVTFHEALVLKSDLEKIKKGEEVGAHAEASEPKAQKPEITAKMHDYIGSWKLIASREQLGNDFDLTQRSLLLMMMFSCGTMGAGYDNVLGRTDEEAADGQLNASPFNAKHSKAYKEAYKSCGVSSTAGYLGSVEYGRAVKKVFKMDIKDVQRCITALVMETMTVHDQLTETVFAQTKPDMSLFWDAESNGAFFNLVSKKAVLLKVLESATTPEDVATQEKSTVKALKAYTHKTAASVKGWLPAYFGGSHYLSE